MLHWRPHEGWLVEETVFQRSRPHPHPGQVCETISHICGWLGVSVSGIFRDHLVARSRAQQRLKLRVQGLEDVLANDVSLAYEWREVASWRWKGASHINIFEAAATLKLFRNIAEAGGDQRFVYFGYSHVARSAISRGRTSSHALKAVLKRFASICIAHGLYPAGRFTPTRVNPADALSRGGSIPDPVPLSLSEGISPCKAAALAKLSSIRGWVANWIRLTLLLARHVLDFLIIKPELRSHSFLPLGFLCLGHLCFSPFYTGLKQ